MPFLWPPGMQQTPAPWSPNRPRKTASSCSSTPTRLVDECGDTPSDSPVRRTLPQHTGGLKRHTQDSELFNNYSSHISTDRLHELRAHRPECRLPAGWWCSCVCRSSSSSPFQRWGQTGLSQWRPLRTTTSLYDICFMFKLSESHLDDRLSLSLSHLSASSQPPWWYAWAYFCRSRRPQPEPLDQNSLHPGVSPESAWGTHTRSRQLYYYYK